MQGHPLTFSNREGWTDSMLRELTGDSPYGYQRATLEQLLGTDKEVLRPLAKETRDDLASSAGREPPLAPRFQAICNEPGAQALLLPLPEGTREGKRSRSASRSRNKRKQRGGDADRGGGKKHDGKAKDGGRKDDSEKKSDKEQPNKRGNPRMPTELQGQCACREDGKPICFGCNFETRSAMAAGQKCGQGWHSRCKPKRGRPHPFKKRPWYSRGAVHRPT